MAFNINAHVILQGPKNIQSITNTIKSQLGGINVPINLQIAGGGRGVSQLNSQLQNMTSSAATARKGIQGVGSAATKTGAALQKTGVGAGRLKANLKGIERQAQANCWRNDYAGA